MIFIAPVNILVSSCVQAGVVTAEVVRSNLLTRDIVLIFTTWRLTATLLSSFGTYSVHSLAQCQFDIVYLGAGVSIGTVQVGLISQMLAGVIIIVTDTGTGGGLGQGLAAAADWILGISITIISMGAELA